MTIDGVSYAFQVQGHLDDHWTRWLGDVTITHNDNGTSTFVAFITDQAELHGLLVKVRDLGITLLAITRTTLLAGPSEAGLDQSPTPPEHSRVAGQLSPESSPDGE